MSEAPLRTPDPPDSVAAAAQRWAEVWQRCWESGDVASIVDLYADAAVFSSQPFRPQSFGREGVRDYVSGAFADESDVRAWFGTPIAEGERATVEWWVALREAGEEVTLAGTSVLRFDSGGRVAEQRDTWNMCAGRREPPPGWGR